ncbi:SDR family oxidoreductase [candidate division KSB1 bacterium]|nr:SDR family oxidoreductase [candidate division KSB1 bacterium]
MDLSKKKRILVIGATGGVGRPVCNEVIRF